MFYSVKFKLFSEGKLCTHHDFYNTNDNNGLVHPDLEIIFVDNGASIGHFHLRIDYNIAVEIGTSRVKLKKLFSFLK